MVELEEKKILIIGPAWVGDMVMAQSLFKILKARNPQTIIDVIAPSWSQALLERMPEVNHVLELPIAHGELALRKRRLLAKKLRAEKYSQAIVLPNSFKSALIPYWAKIPKRTGWRGEWRYGLLNDLRMLDENRLPLMVERFAALALEPDEALPEIIPKPHLDTSPADITTALQKHRINYPDQPVLALCPGAEFGPSKRWPASYFAEVANHKIAQGWAVWLFGSVNDQAIADEIQNSTEQLCINLTGKTTLAEAIDLLSLATVVVSNDSGLMHIAAALQRPLVAIYGSTSPAFTPPLTDEVEIVSQQLSCSPCFKRTCPLKHFNCMLSLPSQQVIAAVEKVLQL